MRWIQVRCEGVYTVTPMYGSIPETHFGFFRPSLAEIRSPDGAGDNGLTAGFILELIHGKSVRFNVFKEDLQKHAKAGLYSIVAMQSCFFVFESKIKFSVSRLKKVRIISCDAIKVIG